MVQKITPFLWFDKNAEEAMNFYVSVFKESKVVSIKRYPDGPLEGPMKGMEGKVLTEVFELEGQTFMALDGGPFFKFNPAVSLTVCCQSVAETEKLFKTLLEGGSALMPLQKYPFSEMYGWLQDKYGVSWQIGVSENKQAIIPSLMFVGKYNGRAEEAINFYTSIFKSSSVQMMMRYESGEHIKEGLVKYSSFLLEGQPFIAMDSGSEHKFEVSGAISMYVECAGQEEVDYYWNKLTEGGDEKVQQCGWLQDKYGFSWQIVPKVLSELLNDSDKVKAGRVMQAMLKMKKIDVEGLKKAYEQA